jgi:hypothetical protein
MKSVFAKDLANRFVIFHGDTDRTDVMSIIVENVDTNDFLSMLDVKNGFIFDSIFSRLFRWAFIREAPLERLEFARSVKDIPLI